MSDPITWHQVHWPHPLDAAKLTSLLKRLASDSGRRPLIFEARARSGQVTHLLGTSDAAIRRITRIIEELVPGATVSEYHHERHRLGRGARLDVRQQAISLDTSTPVEATRVLLEALAAARTAVDEIALQVILGHGVAPTPSGSRPNDPGSSWLDLLLRGNHPALPSTRASMQTKQGQFGFRAIVRVGAVASSEPARRALMTGMQSALGTLRVAGNGLRLVRDFDGALDDARIPLGWPTRLSVDEVVTLLAPPLGKEALPGLPTPHPKLLGPGLGYREPKDHFAISSAPGKSVKLGSDIAGRLSHSVFLGPTGAGKSTAMTSLIRADIMAGRSVVVLDPKADLVSEVLRHIPRPRMEDVVIIDPTEANPVGLNPLITPGSSAELTADGILSIFKDLFASSLGPRTTDVMHAALLTLAHQGKASLVWLPRLLTDPGFRRSLTGRLDDPVALGPFWAQFEALSPGQQAQVIAPAMSRLRQLLLRPSLRAVLGQVEPKFGLQDVFTNPRIVLVALNKGMLGPEAAKLLGSLIVSQLWQLTLARAATPLAQRTPVSIYVDEMQDFLHLPTDVADALSQSRSMGVAWHLAHQYRAQAPKELLAAIDANARNTVVFGLDATDALDMARHAPELEAIDFQTLRTFEVYCRLMNDGQRTGWISGRTLPLPPAMSDELELRALSQARYGQDPSVIDRPGAESSGASVPDELLGRKSRHS